jgi:hypothetical protein
MNGYLFDDTDGFQGASVVSYTHGAGAVTVSDTRSGGAAAATAGMMIDAAHSWASPGTYAMKVVAEGFAEGVKGGVVEVAHGIRSGVDDAVRSGFATLSRTVGMLSGAFFFFVALVCCRWWARRFGPWHVHHRMSHMPRSIHDVLEEAEKDAKIRELTSNMLQYQSERELLQRQVLLMTHTPLYPTTPDPHAAAAAEVGDDTPFDRHDVGTLSDLLEHADTLKYWGNQRMKALANRSFGPELCELVRTKVATNALRDYLGCRR